MPETTSFHNLNSERFDDLIIKSRVVAAIAFRADWCRPSKLQIPVMENLHRDYSKQAMIHLLDVDHDSVLAERFDIRTLPTTLLFADGELIEALIGFQQEEFLRSYLDHLLAVLAQQQKQQQEQQQKKQE